MYSTSKDTHMSAERRGVQKETSSLTFGYGLRDKICWRWRHWIVNKASELFPILRQGSNSSALISNCSFIFVYQASFIKLFSKGQMWCVFLVYYDFSWHFLSSWIINSACQNAAAPELSTGALDYEPTQSSVLRQYKCIKQRFKLCVRTAKSCLWNHEGKTELCSSSMFLYWFWSLLVQ